MINMFKQLFAAVTSFLVMAENLGQAGVHVSMYAREAAAALEDEARADRTKKQNKLNAIKEAA